MVFTMKRLATRFVVRTTIFITGWIDTTTGTIWAYLQSVDGTGYPSGNGS
ncbi:hypothetical protein BRADI_4g35916v3 [Brachypodium distachyon]|uniref:Uncharacterized protein n=1 Tax=Brachypodium distachyon TaxID=15368 RepID=A0A0Q3IYG8_BRADI|nr:hypothetical protein BRADI_4g35916v3 [Brachypodium distachyon]